MNMCADWYRFKMYVPYEGGIINTIVFGSFSAFKGRLHSTHGAPRGIPPWCPSYIC